MVRIFKHETKQKHQGKTRKSLKTNKSEDKIISTIIKKQYYSQRNKNYKVQKTNKQD